VNSAGFAALRGRSEAGIGAFARVHAPKVLLLTIGSDSGSLGTRVKLAFGGICTGTDSAAGGRFEHALSMPNTRTKRQPRVPTHQVMLAVVTRRREGSSSDGTSENGERVMTVEVPMSYGYL